MTDNLDLYFNITSFILNITHKVWVFAELTIQPQPFIVLLLFVIWLLTYPGVTSFRRRKEQYYISVRHMPCFVKRNWTYV